MTALPPDVVADLRQENARLQAELRASRDRQAASAEILRAIAGTSGDAEQALQQIAEITARLFNCQSVRIRIAENGEWVRTIAVGASAERVGAEVSVAQARIGARNLPGTVVLENRQIHIPDLDNLDPAMADWPGLPHARAAGTRTMSGTPLRREGKAIGVLIVYRYQPAPFTTDELALLQTFADQAVIAIENARLFHATQAALERQNASAEILRAIAGALGNAEQALQQIAETSARLFGAPSVSLRIAENGEWVKVFRVGASAERVRSTVPAEKIPIGGRNLPGTVVHENRQIHIPDLDNLDPAIADWPGLPPARAAGTRVMAGTPLRRDGKAFGVLIIYRDRPVPFTAEELALQQSFADQAVIAIENTRLFNETREALERQTATADILKVIASSPSDVQPVFEAIATSAKKLIGGFSAVVFRFVDSVAHVAAFTPTNLAADQLLKASFPRPVAEFPPFEQALAGGVVQVPDTEAEPDARMKQLARARGFRSALNAPLMSKETPLGLIVVTRENPGSFADHHVQLLQTFADQAVIAIENTRLFNETKEALAQQTATSEVLRVISSSVADTAPVFEKILDSCENLFATEQLGIFLVQPDGQTHVGAWRGAAFEAVIDTFPKPVEQTATGLAIKNRNIVYIPNSATMPDMPAAVLAVKERIGDFSIVWAPMLGEDNGVGAISAMRQPPSPFSEKELALLSTFADQAVIAIQNSRLFNETREALERQTATADILKVIASSPSDVQPVFEAIATSSNRLIGGFSTAVFRFVDDVAHLAAFTPTTPAADEQLKASFPRPLADFEPFKMAQRGEVVQIADTENSSDARIQNIARARGFRSMLFAPLMMGSGVPIGLISVTRLEPGSFAAHHVQLLRTFADQAVIAIENVRLFEQVQAKTRDLTEALTYQTGSSNILSVIASSPTSVEPVLEAIVESACTLCEADDAVVHLREGDELRYAAHHGSIPVGLEKRSINRNFVTGRSVIDKVSIHLPDVLSAEGAEFPEAQEMSGRVGIRTLLSVPLLRENESIGTILLRRTEVNPFNDKQIALLQNFADQAVIAIGNVRLFDEVQAKTRDLSESLQQQTATADVLKVISRSAFDLQTVLETLVRSAVELSGARRGVIFLRDGDLFRFQAISYAAEASPEWVQFLRDNPQKAGRNSAIARSIASGEIICVPDVLADPEINMPATALAGIRAVLAVPLLRDGKVEGIMALSRPTPGPFNTRQIDLVQTFADQAVIAIENVRLFEQVQERTRELSRSLEELRTAQDRLVQTEKLASLGQLTAGIAHEIKNPLNFVNNFAALSAELTDELNDVLACAALSDNIREEVDELTRMLKENLERVVQHGKRADSIVKNMLLHSREGSGEHRPADINALLDESLNLAYHGARAEKPQFNVTLQRDFDAMAGMIELFPQEITRVLLNLISNGFYAVTKRKTENGGPDFEPVLSAATRNLGDAVEIRIRDNGTGIPAEVREKMFNPFFTTKPAGEGTGLGLSMSHDIIVKQHGGRIDVETEPGEFTEFRIVLPRTSRLSDKDRGQT